MGKEETFEVQGVVEECLKDTKFRVKIQTGEQERIIIAHLSGKMRKNYIRILAGDTVKIEMTPYDLTKGRIIFRQK
jgi:translation initiation factor IF-1